MASYSYSWLQTLWLYGMINIMKTPLIETDNKHIEKWGYTDSCYIFKK